MSEHRRKILEMLSTGQITADEAERLIAALETEAAGGARSNGTEASPKAKPKYLRVMVENEDNYSGAGPAPTTVNVRVPMQLLRAGVRLASLIPAQARDRVNQAMQKEGWQIDLNQIKPENLEELIDHLDDLTVDVDDKNHKSKVRVFCE